MGRSFLKEAVYSDSQLECTRSRDYGRKSFSQSKCWLQRKNVIFVRLKPVGDNDILGSTQTFSMVEGTYEWILIDA